MKNKPVNVVEIDSAFCEMINWAVRYACGRKTYAALDTAAYVNNIADKLDTQTLSVILKDIEEREKISLGDDIDARAWIKLKHKIERILYKRGFFKSLEF